MDNTKPTRESKPNSSHSAEFLIQEFIFLNEQARSYEELRSSRVNFFLIVVGSVTVMTAALLQLSVWPVPNLTLISACSIVVLGLATLDQIVDYSISIVTLHRRAGRVRRWFSQQDAAIEEFLPFPSYDDVPKLVIGFPRLIHRGGDAVLLGANSLGAAVISFAIVSVLVPATGAFAVLVGAASGILAWYMQKLWIYKKLEYADRHQRDNIHFPEPLTP